MPRKSTYHRPKCLTVKQFMNLKLDRKVYVNHFNSQAIIASKPRRKGKYFEGEELKMDLIDVTFLTGPWKGRTLEVVRQHIHRVL